MGRILDDTFLKKLQPLSMNLRGLASSKGEGQRKSRARGSSVEFSDFREYSPGDDLRRVDWNAYGRFEKLFVKLYTEEREARVNIFIDCSKSMDYGKSRKSHMALKLGAVFSYISLNNMDSAVVNLLREEGMLESRSFSSKSSFFEVVNMLEGAEFKGRTNLSSIKRRKLGRGISIVISDFFAGDVEEVVKYLRYSNQEVFLIHVLSPEEIEPEQSGEVLLIDSESRNRVEVSISRAALKKYRERLEEFQGGLKELSKKFSSSYSRIISDRPIERVVFEDLSFEVIK